MTIEVVSAGRYASIQDRGRPGFERFGVPPGGAADWFAAAVANRLVGNHADAALIEAAAGGLELRFLDEATVALAGAGSDDQALPSWQAREVAAGQQLRLGQPASGLRAYLAVRGGIDAPMVLGSRSFCARGAFGGGFGRTLARGDRLTVGAMAQQDALSESWPETHRLPRAGPWEVRVIAGPHLEAFGANALERLERVACRVTPAIDRMGLRLETPGLHLRADEILTTPVTAGALQVTPSGELIALLVDHPTTGGYPVISTVITADLPRLAQARPGDTMRFRQVDLAEAGRAHRRLLDWLSE
jgi:antagonist of KipI